MLLIVMLTVLLADPSWAVTVAVPVVCRDRHVASAMPRPSVVMAAVVGPRRAVIRISVPAATGWPLMVAMTVTVEVWLGLTRVGLALTARVAAAMVTEAVAVLPPELALTVAVPS